MASKEQNRAGVEYAKNGDVHAAFKTAIYIAPGRFDYRSTKSVAALFGVG